MIAAKTIIGFGSPNKKDSYQAHGSPLGDAEIALARKELDWAMRPLKFPPHILTAWRAVGAKRGKAERNGLGSPRGGVAQQGLSSTAHVEASCPPTFDNVITDYKKALAEEAAAHRHAQLLAERARCDQRRRCPKPSAARLI